MSVTFARLEIHPNPETFTVLSEAARRVADSQTFSRSDQLRRLLLHLCKQSVTGQQDRLHEQQIGVDVFGRSPDYDPGIDGIVRTHATRLRQRLELYFNQEGANDLIRIEIPRGGYMPRFYSHSVATEESRRLENELATASTLIPPTLGQAPVVSDSVRSRSWNLAIPFVGGILLALLLIGIFLHLRQDTNLRASLPSDEGTDIERRFWSSLLPAKQRTRVITGDSGLVMFETLAGREISLSDYLQGSYRGIPHPITEAASLTHDELAMDLANRRYTSAVDLALSAALVRLPEWNAARDELLFARDLRPADANESNLILIGSRQANPWVSLIEPKLNFVLRQKPGGDFYFINQAPRPNEQKQYEARSDSKGGTPLIYGDVAFLPNPSGKGMVLAFGGLWMSGTEAAGQFVLTGKGFSTWLRSIQRRDGSIPPFEILVASHALDGSSTQSEVVAQRVAL
jgi:hypothetical protein